MHNPNRRTTLPDQLAALSEEFNVSRSLIAERIRELKQSVAKHSAAYPGASDRTKLSEWRSGFDSLKGDLERLEFAQKNQPGYGS